MCLTKVTEVCEPDLDEKPKWYWKVFGTSPNGKLLFPFYSNCAVAIGSWMDSSSLTKTDVYGTEYTAGFHCFLTRAAAKAYIRGEYVHVKGVGVLARGIQCDHKCVVLSRILIPKAEKKTKPTAAGKSKTRPKTARAKSKR